MCPGETDGGMTLFLPGEVYSQVPVYHACVMSADYSGTRALSVQLRFIDSTYQEWYRLVASLTEDQRLSVSDEELKDSSLLKV